MSEASQIQGMLIEGVGHIDFLYGKVGEGIVRPLLQRIIKAISEIPKE